MYSLRQKIILPKRTKDLYFLRMFLSILACNYFIILIVLLCNKSMYFYDNNILYKRFANLLDKIFWNPFRKYRLLPLPLSYHFIDLIRLFPVMHYGKRQRSSLWKIYFVLIGWSGSNITGG